MQKLKQLFQGNLYRYGQLIISLANKPKPLTSPHAFPYRHHRLFDPAKTMQRAISDTSSATKKANCKRRSGYIETTANKQKDTARNEGENIFI